MTNTVLFIQEHEIFPHSSWCLSI